MKYLIHPVWLLYPLRLAAMDPTGAAGGAGCMTSFCWPGLQQSLQLRLQQLLQPCPAETFRVLKPCGGGAAADAAKHSHSCK
jgi:hypothetical protein